MGAVSVILSVIIVLAALVMIVTVLLQSSKEDGMGAISGSSQTFQAKAHAKTVEAKLAFITKIAAIVFVVLSLLLLIVNKLA